MQPRAHREKKKTHNIMATWNTLHSRWLYTSSNAIWLWLVKVLFNGCTEGGVLLEGRLRRAHLRHTLHGTSLHLNPASCIRALLVMGFKVLFTCSVKTLSTCHHLKGPCMQAPKSLNECTFRYCCMPALSVYTI